MSKIKNKFVIRGLVDMADIFRYDSWSWLDSLALVTT